jgi:subfamily B ATP-binding cassette protein MsbA
MTGTDRKSLMSRARTALAGVRAAAEYLIEAFRKTSYQRKKISREDIVFLSQFIRPVWKLGLASVILVLLTAALQSLMPLNTKFFIDFVVMKNSTDGLVTLLDTLHLGAITPVVVAIVSSLPFLILFIISLAVMSGILEILQGYVGIKYQQELAMSIQTKLFEHVLRFPISFFKNQQTGYLLARISSDIDNIQSLFSAAILFLFQHALYLIFAFAILFSINFKLALITFCIIPPYLLINAFFGQRLRSVNYRERESSAEVSRDIQEALSGVEVIKSYATEDREVKKVSAKIRNVIEARKISAILGTTSSFIMRSAQLVFTLLIMWFGYQEINSGAMSVGDYVAFTTYVVMVSSAINNIFTSYLALQRVFVSVDRVMEIFRIVPENEEDMRNKDIMRPDRMAGHVRYEQVTFAYEKGRPVLKDIGFEVNPGESITIVGPSGAGKSTIINLLLKFYIPMSGTVYVDDIDVRRIDRQWLREQIGIVSQDIFLFNDTIENNIRYGRPGATRAEVEAAARKAHIHQEIAKFPQGYDTVVGEKGIKLSVGQRQRISIARAFLKDTPVLVLDEPTSSIDPAIENMIKESLRELMKGRTTIIISHRMAFANLSDHILVIREGKIVEEGTHEELIGRSGLYYQLCSPETT